MSTWEIAAQAAARAEAGMVVGLGTGRAASGFVRALGARVRGGLAVQGVPTSEATRRLAGSLGIPLVGLDDVRRVDLAVDGADEVDPARDMIKGHGGAMVRERVVATLADRFVILVGPEKVSGRLGILRSVPVEVVPFAVGPARRALRDLGAEVRLRPGPDGAAPFRTDNGNLLLLARFPGIRDAARLHRDIRRIPGVLDSGLFLGMAHEVLVEAAEAPGREAGAR